MGTNSKEVTKTSRGQMRGPTAEPAEPPSPTKAEIDCLIGRLEVDFLFQPPDSVSVPNGRRAPYSFD